MCPLSVVLFMSSLTFQMPSTAYVLHVVCSGQAGHRELFLFSLHSDPLYWSQWGEKPGNIVVMVCRWVLSGFIGQFKIDTTSCDVAVWYMYSVCQSCRVFKSVQISDKIAPRLLFAWIQLHCCQIFQRATIRGQNKSVCDVGVMRKDVGRMQQICLLLLIVIEILVVLSSWLSL